MKSYGLIGTNLAHSFSVGYFADKFERLDIDAKYQNLDISTPADVSQLFERDSSLVGINVTMPFKETVIPCIDKLSSDARAIGAVNTIKREGKELVGYNTDWIGFGQSIKPFLAHGMEKALILGTGGSSKAVAYALTRLGIDVVFATRNPEKENHLAYSSINEFAIGVFKLVVNTTPLGSLAQIDQAPPIPYEAFTVNHLAFDLVYNPSETKFLKLAKEQGAIAVNGLSMLKLQAEASWKIWNS